MCVTMHRICIPFLKLIVSSSSDEEVKDFLRAGLYSCIRKG